MKNQEIDENAADEQTDSTADVIDMEKPGLHRRTVLGSALAALAGAVSGVSAVKTADGDFTAVSDGVWSDPDTWESGQLPTDGSDVRIQEGVTVTVAERISTRVKHLTVAGTLRHATDGDSRIRAETIETERGSRYEIGTSEAPVQQGVTTEVEFIDEGPIDENEWPDRKNKGLLAHGDVEIAGAEKTTWTTLATAPTAGDTSIELSAEPTNWNPGDAIVIPGVNPYTSTALENEDEERTIASVSGTTVSFETPLEHDHAPPKDALDSYVLNLSRNVVLSSENTAVDRRGHVMIMSTGSNIRYVRFDDLGRTNKDEYLTNPFRGEDELPDGLDPNPSARYPLHWHHTGIDAGEPHRVEGAVVHGSPGWGVVNHHAYAEVTDSITYDVRGAGFVAEGGNERGSFDNCFALRSEGSGETIDSRSAGAHGGDPPIDDFGHAGHGFWLQSPLVRVTDCVAAGHRHQAFVWWLRPLLDGHMAEGDDIDDSRVTYHPNLPVEYIDEERHAPLLEAIGQGRFSNGNDDVMRETGKIPSTFAGITEIRGNVAFGSAGGVDFSRHNFKWKHERFSDFNVIEDLTVHSIGTFIDADGNEHSPEPPRHRASGHQGRGGDVGVSFRYTSNVVLRNSTILGANREHSIGAPFHDYLWTRLIENCEFAGWDWGVDTGEHRLDWVRNSSFGDNNVDINWGIDNVGPAILEGNDFDTVTQTVPANEKASEVMLTDSMRGLRVGDRNTYLADSAPDHVPFPDTDSLDYVNGWGDVIDDETQLVGLTNTEMLDQYGLAWGGTLVPDDAVDEPWARDIMVGPAGSRDPPTSVYLDSVNADELGAFEVVSEADVAGGECLRSTGSSAPTENPAAVTFDCAAGTYTIHGRIRPDAWNGDSVHFRIDDGQWYEAEKLKSPIGFEWHVAAPNGGEPYEWELDEGSHTLEIACGNDGVLIDEIFVGSDNEVLGAYGESLRENVSDNTAPTASDDEVTVPRGDSVAVEVLSNDSDADGSLDLASVTITADPSNGTATVNADGAIEYTHDGSDTDSDSFAYTVDDDEGATSNEATVSVTVESIEQAPYTDHDLSRIQAEDFDHGGEGVAYHDTSDGNNGGVYRETNVDIEETADESGGYNIGWIRAGEWWEYTVEVPEEGEYAFSARLAGKNATTLDVSIDGSDVATVDVPDTGNWQEWTTVDAGSVSLSAGTHTARLTANGDDFNLNWFGFAEHSDTTAPAAPSNLSASNVTATAVDLSWDAASDSGTGVDHYTVYQDGTAVTQVSAGTTSTMVRELQDGTEYDFHVTAVDGAGNESDPSNTVSVTTVDVKKVAVTGDGASSYNGGSTVRYIIETSGTIESAGTGDLEPSDREGGSEAAGKVPADGSDTDTFSLVGGEITDVSTWGGDVTVTVNNTLWSG